jgi:hypothetical protein
VRQQNQANLQQYSLTSCFFAHFYLFAALLAAVASLWRPPARRRRRAISAHAIG